MSYEIAQQRIAEARRTNSPRLNLSNLGLTELPLELFGLTNLRVLWLSENQLTALPTEFGKLTKLARLRLNKNQLAALPPAIGELTKLHELWLHDNLLEHLPNQFWQLTQLRSLNLNSNQLTKLPVTISQLKELIELNLGNDLRPSEMLSRLGKRNQLITVPAEIGQLKNLQKLLLNNNLLSSVPVEFAKLSQLKGLNLSSNSLTTVPVEFSQLSNLQHLWLNNNQLTTVPVEFSQLSNLRGLSLNNNQLTTVPVEFSQLIETAANLPLIGELSPPAWTAVKETLRQRRQTEKACTPAALEDLIGTHGVTAPASQKRLMRFLNELGEIIHYPDNPVLRDTVLLDPEWVSQTISFVLDDEEVKRGLGYFRRETMDRIWRHLDLGMPERMLNLMEEFDLSYRTLDDREISIVVERLQQDPPEDWDKEWNAVPAPYKEITMEFKLETDLPPGIPSWFIARQHQYTRNTHWRRGAVFADDRQNPKHWAWIEAYPERSLVRLTVRGPVPHDFFSRMRRGLRETFNRYEGLREGKFRVVETVPCPGKLENAPCTYEHEVTDLERKLERGKNKMTCNRCDEEIAVPELLLGIQFEPTYEKLEAIHADLLDTRDKVEEIHSLVSTLQGGHAELFNAFQHIEEMQSPYVFVLRTGSYDSDLTGLFHGTGIRGNALSEMRHRLWKEKMELQLYCQHPGEWHPLGYHRGKDDPATGLYQVEVNGELLLLLAPYLPKLTKLLKYAKPFVQGAKVMAGLPPVAPEVEGLKNIIESDHGLMERLVKNLPSPEDLAKQTDKVRSLEDSAEAKMMRGLGDAPNPTEARGSLLRQLRRLLLEKDKDQIWGGLQRKYVKAEGHHLWLCPDHLAQYRQ